MREATITVPVNDNQGRPLSGYVTSRISKAILDEFGGFTAIPARGAWRNPANGLTYTEPVEVYHIAMTYAKTHAAAALERVAILISGIAGQASVYYTTPDGEAHFYVPEPIADAA